jgi:hypothetical protein
VVKFTTSPVAVAVSVPPDVDQMVVNEMRKLYSADGVSPVTTADMDAPAKLGREPSHGALCASDGAGPYSKVQNRTSSPNELTTAFNRAEPLVIWSGVAVTALGKDAALAVALANPTRRTTTRR